MKKMILCLFVLTFVFGFSVKAYAQILFYDDFEPGASPLWGNELGDWYASGGVYQAGSLSNNPPTRSSLPFQLKDFHIYVQINNVRDGGIWLRSSNLETPGSSSGVMLITGGFCSDDSGLYWHVVKDGEVGPCLNVKTGLFIPGESDPYLRIEVTGNTYSAFLYGSETPVTTLTNSDFPSGQVALYDYSAQTFDEVDLFSIPACDIKANNLEGPVSLKQSDTLSVTIELDDGEYEWDFDVWVLAQTPFGWYHLTLPSEWQPGMSCTYRGRIGDGGPIEVLNISGLPVGCYYFYFGVDPNPNCVIDEPLYYDDVKVCITP